MKLTNQKIYSYASALMRSFNDANMRLPAKVNFYIQKNKNTILSLGEEIDKARYEILQHYGTLGEDGNFNIPKENVEVAYKELNDLFEIEQDVNILKFSIEKFDDNINLSMEQMEAIMFMIEEA